MDVLNPSKRLSSIFTGESKSVLSDGTRVGSGCRDILFLPGGGSG